jgi:hypothetical protein
MASKDEDLLKEIRDSYVYLDKKWRKPREERKTDLRYLMGDPWEPKARAAREDKGRLCLNHDELRQYINQAINAVRQNKRGIKVDPDGANSSEQEAELRQDLIRTIEYKCGAPYIYISSGFEQAVRGGYGFFRIGRRYVGKTFDQEIVIKPILNPDSVLFDWDCKEVDWSDARKCFVLDWMIKNDFKRKYKDAEVKDFTGDHRTMAPDWIHADKVLVAEYWKVESEFSMLYLTEGDRIATERPPRETRVLTSREHEEKTIVQYITNGVEIIKRIPQPGEIIPIIPVIGEEIWTDGGEGVERVILSLPRLARDPQMSLAYLVSQMSEEAKMTPKVKFIGYKGQFESDREAWENLYDDPRAYIQVDPMVDGAGGAVLPKPQFQPFAPNFQQYIMAQDSCRRAIQAAMGISPLPTSAQRNNEKSGIALERIAQSQAIGSYHFADRFDMFLSLAGRVMDSWIYPVYGKQRKLTLRKANDTTYKATINTEAPYIDEKDQEQHYKIEESENHITISTGPSNQSQREEVTQFLDLLVSNIKNLPLAPEQMQKLLGLAIRMKQMGPRGDEMADIIDPKKQGGAQIPPEIIQQMQGLQQQCQALNEYAKQKEAEIQKLQQEKDAKIVDNQFRLEIEKMKIEADIAKAEITTKAQALGERMQFVEDLWKQFHGQAHEAGLAAQQQGYERQLADQQAQVAAQQQEATATTQEEQQPIQEGI